MNRNNNKWRDKDEKNPPNNKQRSAEGLMYITNSLTVQEEEFAQLKYSDVQPSSVVGVRGAQKSGVDRSLRHKTMDSTARILLNNTNFYIFSDKNKKERIQRIGRNFFPVSVSVFILILYPSSY
jgi:hypothetical protein